MKYLHPHIGTIGHVDPARQMLAAAVSTSLRAHEAAAVIDVKAVLKDATGGDRVKRDPSIESKPRKPAGRASGEQNGFRLLELT